MASGRLDGARAVVTGAGSGLGRAFCVEIGARGGRVVVSDIDLDGAAETARLVEQRGGTARVVACDVRSADAVQELADAATDWFGDVDLVINNAGVAVAGPMGEVSLEDWRWVVDINMWGVIYGCHVFVPRMKAAKHGFLINVASAAGLLSPPEMAPYNVTKSAVVALSETLHAELKADGVHVSVLCPTFFRTNIAESARGPNRDELAGFIGKLMDKSKQQAPEVAQAALQAVEANQLYCVPMQDGRTAWRLKRLTPERWPELAARGAKLVRSLARRNRRG